MMKKNFLLSAIAIVCTIMLSSCAEFHDHPPYYRNDHHNPPPPRYEDSHRPADSRESAPQGRKPIPNNHQTDPRNHQDRDSKNDRRKPLHQSPNPHNAWPINDRNSNHGHTK